MTLRTVARHAFNSSAVQILLGATILSIVASVTSASAIIPGRFIVKVKSEASIGRIRSALSTGQALNSISRLNIKNTIKGRDAWNRYLLLETDDSTLTKTGVVSILGSANIEFVEQDRTIEFFDYPTEPLFGEQWYLHNSGQTYMGINRLAGDFNDQVVLKSGLAGIDVRKESLYQTPPAENTKVVVAIIDSGTDLLHPELQGQMWKNPDEIPYNGVDDDHNGFIDDTLGYDVSGDIQTFGKITGDNNPSDIVGHGTHIAGIIAARGDSTGIIGVAPTAQIMTVKIRPNATNAVGAAGIMYAVNAGAQVINLSWGTPYESLILREAVSIARQNGVFVVIAAGNSGSNQRFYPAAFDSAFAVGALASNGYMTTFSTWGAIIDLVAPGQDILSLRASGTDLYSAINESGVHIIGPDSLYYLADGTSMAAPLVAGAAALLLSIRPDLTLNELETILRLGATDMVDPHNTSKFYPGPDTVSGYGMLNVDNALELITSGGIFLTQPISNVRYTDSLYIKGSQFADYTGGWKLEYALDDTAFNWQLMAQGSNFPTNSTLFFLNDTSLSGIMHLRLSNDVGGSKITRFTYVNSSHLRIESPVTGNEYKYSIPIIGSAFGRDYDSVQLFYSSPTVSRTAIFSSTREYFNSLIYTWDVSGVPADTYTVHLHGYYQSLLVRDSVRIVITSAFAAGWPQQITGHGALSAVSADLDGDQYKEIIVGATNGLFAFRFDGQLLPGFPVMPNNDMRSIPAIYDIDRDGSQEIICLNEDGILSFEMDGSMTSGWPQPCATGLTSYGFPHPSIARLGTFEDSAIITINGSGQILAYEFNGDPYFYSLDGWFASFNSEQSLSYIYGGNSVSAADLDGDGHNEVIATYSTNGPLAGVAVFEGRTGQPAFDRPLPQVIEMNICYGTVMTDINGDNLPDIVSCGVDSFGNRIVYAKTHGVTNLPGWPIILPQVAGWRGSFPTAADLDLDGRPEIILTFFELDVGALYIFKSDGTPYIEREGRPYGEAYRLPLTFGTPIVADLTGDSHPEIVIRSGYIFPGTGTEKVHILDFTISPIAGWPVSTPAPPLQVFSTIFAPLVDDIDNDGLVELVLVSETGAIYIWDFDASSRDGKNSGRLFADNRNSGFIPAGQVVTDVEEPNPLLPKKFELWQNYPNPFNPTTSIVFDLPTKSNVTLEIFNVLGQQVTILIDKQLTAGRYSVPFDASAYSSGFYFYTLSAGDFTASRKMVFVK